MNQGNSHQFRGDDGVWQDGGLLLHYPTQDQWVAIFLAFQSQAWHTDDQTGHALPSPEPGAADSAVRIVAALVNPPGPAPEAETVTLLNASPQDIDLTGWSILDREKRQLVLDGGSVPAGDTVRVLVGPPVQLGNRGGLMTLLDPAGLKVDGVAYTKSQAAAEDGASSSDPSRPVEPRPASLREDRIASPGSAISPKVSACLPAARPAWTDQRAYCAASSSLRSVRSGVRTKGTACSS